MKKIILSILTISLFTFSCSNDDDIAPVVPLGDYENGILVVGEGGFTTSGTVSFVSEDTGSTINDIYFDVNNEDVGSFFQSIGFNGDQAYLVVDNGVISIVNRYTFEKTGSISTGLSSPRYISFSNGKGYVSNWGDTGSDVDDYIAVINLSTNTVESTIPVGLGPEQLITADNKLFVSHKGAFGINNIVSVIDLSNNAVDTITLDDKPDDMLINEDGDLIVLSEGATLYDQDFNIVGETDASLNKIDVSDNTVISSLNFTNGDHPSLMSYDNGNLYYVLNNKVYTMTDSDQTLPANSILDLNVGFAYGMSINDSKLYVNDANFAGQSALVVFDLNALTELETFTVGLAASKIYFN
jgi:YVTN family beta-propeller protein